MLTRAREEHIQWGWQESDQTMCRPLLISFFLSVCSFYLVVVLTKMCTCGAHHHSIQMMLINVLVLSLCFFLSFSFHRLGQRRQLPRNNKLHWLIIFIRKKYGEVAVSFDSPLKSDERFLLRSRPSKRTAQILTDRLLPLTSHIVLSHCARTEGKAELTASLRGAISFSLVRHELPFSTVISLAYTRSIPAMNPSRLLWPKMILWRDLFLLIASKWCISVFSHSVR